MSIDFFATALKESLFLPFNTILNIGGNECVEVEYPNESVLEQFFGEAFY